jgi:hypothetical protein
MSITSCLLYFIATTEPCIDLTPPWHSCPARRPPLGRATSCELPYGWRVRCSLLRHGDVVEFRHS